MASYGRPRRHKSLLNDNDDDDDDDEQDVFPQQYTRGRRNRSVLSENDPINTSNAGDEEEEDTINSTTDDGPLFARQYTRSRRDRSVLCANDPINTGKPETPSPPPPPTPPKKEEKNIHINSSNDIKDQEEEQEQQEQEQEQEEEDTNDYDVEETLMAENRDIVFSGYLERKTNQKVLGKHLWETRYFKLSTHSLSVYVNNKTNITESIIKLSSIISMNRHNRLSDGSDLKTNRFDIKKENGTINLRTENAVTCKQWIHFIAQQRKKHRKAIRTGLDKISDIDNTFTSRFRSKASVNISIQNKNKNKNKNKKNHTPKLTNTKVKVRRFKRQKTSRNNNDQHHHKISIVDEDEYEEEEDENENENENENEGDEYDADPEIIDDICTLTKPAEFEGFLVRKIGHKRDQIGEKLFFRLSNDSFEFSKIDEQLNDNEQDLKRKHSTNILGSISIEHIKCVKMISDENENEFVIVFNEHNSNSDWILTTEKRLGNAKQWVNVLLKAQKEAKYIGKTINDINDGEDECGGGHGCGFGDEEDDDDSDSDSEEFNIRRKRKKKLGGSIKALQKMINEETIHELEVARNQELDNKNLVNGFEINSLDNTGDINHNHNNNGPNIGCSCLCFK